MKLVFLLVIITCGCVISNQIRDDYYRLIGAFAAKDIYRAKNNQENSEEMIGTSLRGSAYNAFMMWRELTDKLKLLYPENWQADRTSIVLPDLIEFQQISIFLVLMHVANKPDNLFSDAKYSIVEENLNSIRNSKMELIEAVRTYFADVSAGHEPPTTQNATPVAETENEQAAIGNGSEAAKDKQKATLVDGNGSALLTQIQSLVEENTTRMDVAIYEMMRCDNENMTKILQMYIVGIDEFPANVQLLNQFEFSQKKMGFASKIRIIGEELCGVCPTLKEIINMKNNVGSIEKQLPYHYLVVQLEKAFDFMNMFDGFTTLAKCLKAMGQTESEMLEMPNEEDVDNAVSAIKQSLLFLEDIRSTVFQQIESKNFDIVQNRVESANSFKTLKNCRFAVKKLFSGILKSFPTFPEHSIGNEQVSILKEEFSTHLERGAY